MPEGPEIRRAADRVAAVLVGNEIEQAEINRPGLADAARTLTGSTVLAVETRGKAMLTRFDNGLTIYSHNQLYGRWYTRRRPKLPKTNRQLRLALHTSTHSALLYSASDIDVLDEQGVDEHPFLARIGPDILDPGLTAADVARRLADRRFRNRSLAALYLDQAFLAGLGNYLRSEILFCARLGPSRRPADLSRNERARLARNTLRIPQHSYRTGGLTVPAGLARELEAAGERYGQRRFYVFGRAGRPCRQCRSPVQKTLAGSRNLFLCPGCQPA
jgi:endonuclease-8